MKIFWLQDMSLVLIHMRSRVFWYLFNDIWWILLGLIYFVIRFAMKHIWLVPKKYLRKKRNFVIILLPRRIYINGDNNPLLFIIFRICEKHLLETVMFCYLCSERLQLVMPCKMVKRLVTRYEVKDYPWTKPRVFKPPIITYTCWYKSYYRCFSGDGDDQWIHSWYKLSIQWSKFSLLRFISISFLLFVYIAWFPVQSGKNTHEWDL